jgi:hypothetical protein
MADGACGSGREAASPPGVIRNHIIRATMYYILIRGRSYRNLAFEDREKIRESIRLDLEAKGIRFLEYPWVWDEEDRCLLLVGRYENMVDARWWIRALESMGFEISIRDGLPGDESP